MAGARFWSRVVAAWLVGAGGMVAATSAASGAPADGPPDSPTTELHVTVTATCEGDAPDEYPFVLTVPESVRAGRPFPVEIALDEAPPPGVVALVGLSVGGATTTDATVSIGGRAHFVATWTPGQDLTLAITRFAAVDHVQFTETWCVFDAPAEVAVIPVRHATPFADAALTAHQRVTIVCWNYPGGWASLSAQDVSLTVPNRVGAGEPFTIQSVGPIGVSGGVRSGQTITPTGAVGETVEIWSDGSYTQYAPPPYPPIPLRICEQEGGAVHLASVPIVAP